MIRKTAAIVFLMSLLIAAPSPVQAESPTVMKADSPEGTVWVGLDLAYQRMEEDYLPLLVVVYNKADPSITLNRSTFKVSGADRQQTGLATLQEVRSEYKMQTFDLTMGRFLGIPIGTKLDMTRMIPSNFFPVLASGSGLGWDIVEIPSLHWTIDLLYFKRPAGLAEGRQVTLVVEPEQWEAPIRISFALE